MLALLGLVTGCERAGDRAPDAAPHETSGSITDVETSDEPDDEEAGSDLQDIARPDASATATRVVAESLFGRLIFAQDQPDGRERIVALDAASGIVEELFVVADSDNSSVARYSLSPDGQRLAYVSFPSEAPPRVLVRRLDAEAPVEIDRTLPAEAVGVGGLHWQADGRSLVLDRMIGPDAPSGQIWVPEGFGIWRLSLDPNASEAGTAESFSQLYREMGGADRGYTRLGAWDEVHGTAALLDVPADGAPVRRIRVLRAVDGDLVADWPAGGHGSHFRSIPRIGAPDANWLAVIDEQAWEDRPANDAPTHVRLVDLEQQRRIEIAEVPAGVQANHLIASADGQFLAWSETPIESGTGLRQRIRFVQIRDEIGRATVLSGAEGLGAIPLAFEPAEPGSWPRILTADGIYRLDLVAEGGHDPSEIRADSPWSLPEAPENVYPSHPLLGLGELIGWVPDPDTSP